MLKDVAIKSTIPLWTFYIYIGPENDHSLVKVGRNRMTFCYQSL